jgi:hypothetical protein
LKEAGKRIFEAGIELLVVAYTRVDEIRENQTIAKSPHRNKNNPINSFAMQWNWPPRVNHDYESL